MKLLSGAKTTSNAPDNLYFYALQVQNVAVCT